MSSGRDLLFAAVGLLAAVLVAGGCATTGAAGPSARAADLERTAIELRAQNAGHLRQIEELQNRIFILEDRIDSLQAANGRDPLAPPPSKRLGGPEREVTTARVVEEPPGEEDDGMVEYAGEAAEPARRGRTRPMLRMAGTGSARISTVAVMPAKDPALPADRIAVKSSDKTTDKVAAREAEPAGNEPLRLYRQALDALHAGRHGAALVGLRKFLVRFPRHDYDDNAQYWIGECYYDLKQYKSALREFRRVVDRYPHGNKVPDALLKMGFAHLALGDRRDGRQDLESLRRLYPKHAAARLAVARLSQPDDRVPASTITLEMTGR
jgi:tol-pal system protein YbgF